MRAKLKCTVDPVVVGGLIGVVGAGGTGIAAAVIREVGAGHDRDNSRAMALDQQEHDVRSQRASRVYDDQKEAFRSVLRYALKAVTDAGSAAPAAAAGPDSEQLKADRMWVRVELATFGSQRVIEAMEEFEEARIAVYAALMKARSGAAPDQDPEVAATRSVLVRTYESLRDAINREMTRG